MSLKGGLTRLERWLNGEKDGPVQWPTQAPIRPSPRPDGRSVCEMMREVQLGVDPPEPAMIRFAEQCGRRLGWFTNWTAQVLRRKRLRLGLEDHDG